MSRRLCVTVVLLLVAATGAGPAHADGLPVVGIDAGPDGVPGPQGDVRYHALRAGAGTLVMRVASDGGQALASRFLSGRFAVPVVAYDGTAAGVSADGSLLAVIRPRARFPRTHTTLALLGAERLKLRQLVRLDGDFSFDALSPDGRWLYLIEYTDPADPTRYLVRTFDVERGSLLPDPVVDPAERPDEMRGLPITRAASPDGRFAYTLYDGAGGHPFVHALDTDGRSAVCIDLDGLAGRPDLFDLRLSVAPDGGSFAIVTGGTPLAHVETRNFEVSEPGPLRVVDPPGEERASPVVPVRAATPPAPARGATAPWVVGAAVAGALLPLGFAAAVLRRRRRPRITPVPTSRAGRPA